MAASVVRTCLGGCWSSGSSSDLTGPPTRAYGHAPKLWATIRSTPFSRAAATRWSVPSVRRRLVVAKERSNLRRSRSPPSAVISWTIASGRAAATAARTPSRSSPSTTTGSAPSSRSRATFDALRVVPVTEWPWLSEEGDERLSDGAGRPGEKDVHAPPTRHRASL